MCDPPLSLSSWRITRMPPTVQGRSNKTRGVISLRVFAVRQRQRPIEKCCSNARQVPSPALMFSLWDLPFLQPTAGIHRFVIGVYILILCPLDRWDSIPSFLIVNYRKCPQLQQFNGWYLLGAHYCYLISQFIFGFSVKIKDNNHVKDVEKIIFKLYFIYIISIFIILFKNKSYVKNEILFKNYYNYFYDLKIKVDNIL